MRLRLVVCWLLLVRVGFCDCHEVQGPPVTSSQKISIAVEKQGKPVKGAKVSVFGQTLPQTGLTVLTDSEGMAKLPTLNTGTYSIEATFEGGTAATAVSMATVVRAVGRGIHCDGSLRRPRFVPLRRVKGSYRFVNGLAARGAQAARYAHFHLTRESRCGYRAVPPASHSSRPSPP